MTVTTTRPRVRLGLADRPVVLDRTTAPLLLTVVLAVAAVVAAGLSLLFPDVLEGEPVIKGNLRGTALVVVTAGVPLLLAAAWRARSGSARGLVLWIGAIAYLLYQAVMLCFATPLNAFFLIYVAYLSAAVWAAVALLTAVHISGFRARVSAHLPVLPVAVAAGVLAVLNALAWLRSAVPASFSDDPRSVLEGSGLLTNVGWVQDLAVWVPVTVLSAVWLARRLAWGALLTGGLLCFYVLESVGVAVDQLFGARADDTTSWASYEAVPLFLVAAALVAVPAAVLLRAVDGRYARPRSLSENANR